MITDQRPGQSRLFYFLNLFIIVGIALGSALWLWSLVHEFPDPSGANGYFYLKQIESLAAGHGFYFKDYSLAFVLPTLLLKMTADPLVSFQLATVITWFFLSLASGLLTSQLLADHTAWSKIFLMALGCTSLILIPQVYEFSLTFYKNAFGLTLFIFAMVIYFSDLSLQHNHRRKYIFTAVLLTLALLSHKSMFLLVVSFLVAWFAHRTQNSLQILKRWGLFVVSLAVVVGLFLWHFEKAAAYLMALLKSFSSPGPWWAWVRALRVNNPEMLSALGGLLLITIFYGFRRSHFSKATRIYGDATTAILLIAMQPFQMPGANGAGYRLLILAPLLALPLAAKALATLNKSVGFKTFAAIVLLLPFWSEPLWGVRQIDDVFTPWAAIREDVVRIKGFVQSEDHLTSHHGLEFFVDEVTGIRSRSFLSDHPEKKAFRLAYVAQVWLRIPEAQQDLHAHALLEIGSEYILITEAEWQRCVQLYKIPKHWKNPDEHRPDFIYE